MFPDTPADILGARLGGWVDGTLQLSHSEGEGDSLEDGVMDPVVEEESCLMCGAPLMMSLSSGWDLDISSRLLRV